MIHNFLEHEQSNIQCGYNFLLKRKTLYFFKHNSIFDFQNLLLLIFPLNQKFATGFQLYVLIRFFQPIFASLFFDPNLLLLPAAKTIFKIL